MRNRSYSSILGTLFLTIVLSGAGTPESPVADAAMRSDVEMLRNLLYRGADVNAAQGDGMTALHWAAVNGQSDIGEMLLYAGASTEATTRMGAYTPLHLASREGHAGVALSLLEAGSDPNQRTSSGGVTPLHFAAASGDVETIETLLNYGAIIDEREEKSGQTPLIFAASLGRRHRSSGEERSRSFSSDGCDRFDCSGKIREKQSTAWNVSKASTRRRLFRWSERKIAVN
jgi:ankyrin repeat protein